MHLQPVFAAAPAYVTGTSERLFRTGLSLPSGSALSEDQFEQVTSAIVAFLESGA
jgi:dTDP-4-amino-4,6-dideoxygalactose transaminase